MKIMWQTLVVKTHSLNWVKTVILILLFFGCLFVYFSLILFTKLRGLYTPVGLMRQQESGDMEEGGWDKGFHYFFSCVYGRGERRWVFLDAKLHLNLRTGNGHLMSS